MRSQLESQRAVDRSDVSGAMRLRQQSFLAADWRCRFARRGSVARGRREMRSRRSAPRRCSSTAASPVADRLRARLPRPGQHFAVLVQRQRAAAQHAGRAGRRTVRTAVSSSTTSSRQTYLHDHLLAAAGGPGGQLLRGAQIADDDVGVSRDQQVLRLSSRKRYASARELAICRRRGTHRARSRSKTWCGSQERLRPCPARMPRLMNTSSIIPR